MGAPGLSLIKGCLTESALIIEVLVAANVIVLKLLLDSYAFRTLLALFDHGAPAGETYLRGSVIHSVPSVKS